MRVKAAPPERVATVESVATHRFNINRAAMVRFVALYLPCLATFIDGSSVRRYLSPKTSYIG